MASLSPAGRRRPRIAVVAAVYIAFGLLMGTMVTFNVRGFIGSHLAVVEGRLETPNPNPRRTGSQLSTNEFMGGETVMRRLADTADFPDIEQVALDSIIDNPELEEEESSATQPGALSLLVEPLLKILGVGRWYADDLDVMPDVVHLYSEHDFREAMVSAKGFEWSELQDNNHPAQWAFVGGNAGSYLELKLDTRTSTSRHGAPHAPVVLTHWRAPHGMGRADVSCVSGCECAATRLDGHWDEPSSGTWGHPFTVSQNADCVLRIKVVPTASAGSSKVMLTELIVLDDPVAPRTLDREAFQQPATSDRAVDRSEQQAEDRLPCLE